MTVKILSCDGGGIRGYLTALLLEELEKELQKLNPNHTLAKSFDLFAGTSTGSIIACGLAKGMSAKEIQTLYKLKGEKIFPTMTSIRFVEQEVLERLSERHISCPLFSPQGLEEVLISEFHDLPFGNLPKPTVVVSYDAYNRKAVIFKSTEAKSAKVPVWQVCRSSSAAPVAFPAYLLKEQQFLDAHEDAEKIEGDLPRQIPKEGIPLIDGGVVANNPSLCALSQQLDQGTPLGDILLVSFGTGQAAHRITPEDAKSWGGLKWTNILPLGIPLFDVSSDGSSDAIDSVAKSLLKNNYLRYQPVITDHNILAFQADQKTLNYIEGEKRNYLVQGGSERLKELAHKLI